MSNGTISSKMTAHTRVFGSWLASNAPRSDSTPCHRFSKAFKYPLGGPRLKVWVAKVQSTMPQISSSSQVSSRQTRTSSSSRTIRTDDIVRFLFLAFSFSIAALITSCITPLAPRNEVRRMVPASTISLDVDIDRGIVLLFNLRYDPWILTLLCDVHGFEMWSKHLQVA